MCLNKSMSKYCHCISFKYVRNICSDPVFSSRSMSAMKVGLFLKLWHLRTVVMKEKERNFFFFFFYWVTMSSDDFALRQSPASIGKYDATQDYGTKTASAST